MEVKITKKETSIIIDKLIDLKVYNRLEIKQLEETYNNVVSIKFRRKIMIDIANLKHKLEQIDKILSFLIGK